MLPLFVRFLTHLAERFGRYWAALPTPAPEEFGLAVRVYKAHQRLAAEVQKLLSQIALWQKEQLYPAAVWSATWALTMRRLYFALALLSDDLDALIGGNWPDTALQRAQLRGCFGDPRFELLQLWLGILRFNERVGSYGDVRDEAATWKKLFLPARSLLLPDVEVVQTMAEFATLPYYEVFYEDLAAWGVPEDLCREWLPYWPKLPPEQAIEDAAIRGLQEHRRYARMIVVRQEDGLITALLQQTQAVLVEYERVLVTLQQLILERTTDPRQLL